MYFLQRFLFFFNHCFGTILSMKTLENPTVTSLQKEVSSLQERLIERDQEVLCLQEQIAWFRNQLFGAKSEKIIADLKLEADGFVVIQPEPGKEKPEPKKKDRKKPDRTGKDAIKLPPNLPVETVIIDLPEKRQDLQGNRAPLSKNRGRDYLQNCS